MPCSEPAGESDVVGLHIRLDERGWETSDAVVGVIAFDDYLGFRRGSIESGLENGTAFSVVAPIRRP